MRNISFTLTTQQVRNQMKTVTRRLGWKTLQAGTLLQPVEKAQWLKKGEHVTKIGAPIRVRMVTQEWISAFLCAPESQMRHECEREGFPELTPFEFYRFFRRTHGDPSDDDFLVTRIEFEYTEPVA